MAESDVLVWVVYRRYNYVTTLNLFAEQMKKKKLVRPRPSNDFLAK